MLEIDATFLVTFIIVWILVIVLTKVFYNPVRRTVQSRKTKLDEDRKATEKALENYEKTIIEIEEKLKKAQAAAQATQDKFGQEAIQEKERMLEEISTECRNQIEGAKKELALQLEKLKKDLDSQSRTLAKRIEERLLH